MAVLPNDERVLNYTLACKTFPKRNMKIELDLSRQPKRSVVEFKKMNLALNQGSFSSEKQIDFIRLWWWTYES